MVKGYSREGFFPKRLIPPEQSWHALEDATRLNGLHQTDSSRHQVGNLTGPHAQRGVLLTKPAAGQATLNVALLFLGTQAEGLHRPMLG